MKYMGTVEDVSYRDCCATRLDNYVRDDNEYQKCRFYFDEVEMADISKLKYNNLEYDISLISEQTLKKLDD